MLQWQMSGKKYSSNPTGDNSAIQYITPSSPAPEHAVYIDRIRPTVHTV